MNIKDIAQETLKSNTTDIVKIASAMFILDNLKEEIQEDNISSDTQEFLEAFELYRLAKKKYLLTPTNEFKQESLNCLNSVLKELKDIIDGVKLSALTEEEQQIIRRYILNG